MTETILSPYFQLPIFYNEKKKSIPSTIVADLELIQTHDPSGENIYSFFVDKKETKGLSSLVLPQFASLYTTDIAFLKDNQVLLQKYSNDETLGLNESSESILEIWNEIKKDVGFKERFYYVDWKYLDFLNTNETFLQIVSVFNMMSPVLSFCLPVLLLIVPFFILQLKGIPISVKEYFEILQTIIQHNAMGRLFTHFHSVSIENKLYLIASAGFYLFSIYQNIKICYTFHENMKKIHLYFERIQKYLKTTLQRMEKYLAFSQHLVTHKEFSLVLSCEFKNLSGLYDELGKISSFQYSWKKLCEIGKILKLFYQLFDNKMYHQCMMYSFGFHGYLDCIQGIQRGIREKRLGFSRFTAKKTKKGNSIQGNYYACLKDVDHVKNTVQLKKHMILSGPNASGKTTMIKSVFINILLTQQFGCGFYESATIRPYHHFHCYLNIPDTSGRDSLFQAEARRCKDILDCIDSSCEETHFCAFDELYSGTNPEEASLSAIAFMKYLVKNKNVDSMLTTHFLQVCQTLDKEAKISNYFMDSKKEDSKIEYLYKLKKGISLVKGGIRVLTDMNYPEEILETIESIR